MQEKTSSGTDVSKSQMCFVAGLRLEDYCGSTHPSMFNSGTCFASFFAARLAGRTGSVCCRDSAVNPLPSSVLHSLHWKNNWHIKLFKNSQGTLS